MSRAIAAGLAQITLRLDDGPFKRQLRAVQSRMRAVSREINQVGQNLFAAGAVGSFGAGFAVARFATLEDALLTVQGVTEGTAEQLERIERAVLAAGRETSFTALQVGDAMVRLARGGQTAEQSVTSLSSVLNLARGTGTDLETTVRGLIASLNQFDRPVSDAARVADTLAIATNRGNFELIDLIESLKFAGFEGAQLGEDLEDVAAALALIANAGVAGTLAGTQLRRAYRNLAETARRERIEEALDLEPLVNSAGNFRRPFNEILREISAASRRLGSVARVELFADIFGRGEPAALALGQASQETFDRIVDDVNNAAGAAQRLATIMDSGVGGAIRLAISAAEAFGLAIGDATRPDTIRLLQFLRTVTVAMEQWIRANQESVRAVGRTIVAVLALGAGLVTLGVGLAAANFALRQFTRVFALFVLPVTLAVRGLSLLNAAFLLAIGTVNRTVQAIRLLPALLQRVAARLGLLFVVTTLFAGFRRLFSVVVQLTATAFGALRRAVFATVTAFGLALRVTGRVSAALLTLAGDALASATSALITFATRAASAAAAAMAQLAAQAVAAAGAIALNLAAGLATAATLALALSFAFSTLAPFINRAIAAFRSFVGRADEVFAPLVRQVNALRSELGRLSEIARALFSDLSRVATISFGSITEAVRAGDIQSAVGVLRSGLVLSAQLFRESLSDAFTDTAVTFIEVMLPAIQQVTNAIIDIPRLLERGALQAERAFLNLQSANLDFQDFSSFDKRLDTLSARAQQAIFGSISPELAQRFAPSQERRDLSRLFRENQRRQAELDRQGEENARGDQTRNAFFSGAAAAAIAAIRRENLNSSDAVDEALRSFRAAIADASRAERERAEASRERQLREEQIQREGERVRKLEDQAVRRTASLPATFDLALSAARFGTADPTTRRLDTQIQLSQAQLDALEEQNRILNGLSNNALVAGAA